MLAKDSRHTPLIEKVTDWITKARHSADVEYPLDNKALVRESLSLAIKAIKNGGEKSASAREALPVILAKAKEMGIGSVESSSSAVIVEKDLSGKWRAVMWPTNNFKDLDGEIITEKAHLDYVAWVNENMEFAPVSVTWHLPETIRKSKADFVGYQNGFLIVSMPLEDDEAAGLFKAMKVCDIGMSHGSLVLKKNKENPRLIEKYLMIECSDLPLSKAANPFTDFAVITKEANMDMQKYLASLLGDEKAEKILEKTGLKQAALREAGIAEKGLQPETEEVKDAPVTSEAAPAADLEQILKAVGERFDIDGLSEFVEKANAALERIPVLEAALVAATEDRDEALAEKISPPIAQKMAWSRPSQSQDTTLSDKNEDDVKLKKSKPETHWLAEQAGVEPVEA
jgi:hypothetical protein